MKDCQVKKKEELNCKLNFVLADVVEGCLADVMVNESNGIYDDVVRMLVKIIKKIKTLEIQLTNWVAMSR